MGNNANIVNETSTLLGLPNKVLNEIISMANLCIAGAIFEAKNNNETVLVVNIGLGTLSINLVDMQCKFLPSTALKSAIKETLSGEKDPVEAKLEEALIARLTEACKEVL